MVQRYLCTRLLPIAICSLSVAQCGSGEEEVIRTYYIPGDAEQQAGSPPEGSPTSSTGSEGQTGSNPDPTPPPPQVPEGTSLLGAIVRISPLGVVEGWAVDTDDLNKTINVSIYFEGPEDGGTLLTTIPANIDGFDNNQDGAHRFVFNLPAEAKPGVSKKLFVKLNDGAGQEGYLSLAGQDYTAYSPKQAGRDFYAANLQGAMTQSCAGCHPGEVNYDNHYTLLIDAAPVNGGTATVNRLVLKASGGLNHGGNNRCGNINSGICANLQQWWAAEFQ